MRLLQAIFFILLISNTYGNNIPIDYYLTSTPDSSRIVNYELENEPIILYDSIYNSTYVKDYDLASWSFKYNFPSDSIPEYKDSIYQQRINYLNTKSPFDFQYNESVRNSIIFFSYRRKGLIKAAMVRKEMYFPLFEKVLDKYQLPMELKYLAIVESALNAKAKSHAGAQGLWQFMPGTGRLYGLHRNSRVDDRLNIYKATEAACQHFCDLYSRYHDWNLVLAAYNAGPGNVNKAIRRAGGTTTDYWAIRQYLPKETQNYVPSFIAVNYMMKYYNAHNIQDDSEDSFHYFETDTIYVSKKVTFKNLSNWLDIDINTIKYLNPQYRRDYIPARMEGTKKSYVLTLPAINISDFIIKKDKIMSGLTPREWELEASR